MFALRDSPRLIARQAPTKAEMVRTRPSGISGSSRRRRHIFLKSDSSRNCLRFVREGEEVRIGCKEESTRVHW